MNCHEFRQSLFAYTEHQLGDGERATLEGHAQACSGCGDLLQRASELTCKDFVAFLQAHLDDELEPEQARVFRRHLEFCPPCVDYLDAYEKTVSLGREVCQADGGLPEEVPEQLIRAVLEAQRRAT